MNKIPVGKTISYAYSFTLANFLSVLGVIWIPFLIMMGGSFAVMGPYLAALSEMAETNDPTAILGAFPYLFLIIVIIFVMMAVILIGLTQFALGLKSGPVFFYFSLGYPVWRLLGAMICAYLLLVLGTLVVGIGVGIVIAAIAAAGVDAEIVVMLVPLIVLVVMVAMAVRLVFFLAPVTVAEGKNVVRRAWAISRGNFWRIFGVILAIVIPVLLVNLLLQFALFGDAAMNMGGVAGEQTPEEAFRQLEQRIDQIRSSLILVVPIFLALAAFMYGVMAAAAAYAYRALVPAGQEPKPAH
jgi:hypothetical protein